jgi:hypothetical protein
MAYHLWEEALVYNIFYDSSWGLHSNDTQNWDFYYFEILDAHIFFKQAFLEHARAKFYNL